MRGMTIASHRAARSAIASLIRSHRSGRHHGSTDRTPARLASRRARDGTASRANAARAVRAPRALSATEGAYRSASGRNAGPAEDRRRVHRAARRQHIDGQGSCRQDDGLRASGGRHDDDRRSRERRHHELCIREHGDRVLHLADCGSDALRRCRNPGRVRTDPASGAGNGAMAARTHPFHLDRISRPLGIRSGSEETSLA